MNDLLRRKLQTSLTVVSLTFCVASTLFLLLFTQRVGFGITSVAEETLTRGLSTVFSQFTLFVELLVFTVGAVLVSFIVFLTMAQRTRDFGLIKAAGCPNGLVFGYFMTELLIMTFAGCLLGVALGFIGDHVIAVSGNSQIPQKPADFWLAPSVFAAYFIFALIFGTKPIHDASKLPPIKAISPTNYFGLSKGDKLKALSGSSITLKIALRCLLRRRSATVRIVLFLSITFVLLTVSIAGSIVASDTTKSWIQKATGRNVILIAHDNMCTQYRQLLSRFSGAEEDNSFDYLDEELLISDSILRQLNTTPGLTDVDPRLIFKGHIRELGNYTIDPETQATIQVGDSREGDSLIVGVEPRTAVDAWFMQGRFLNADDAWEAVIGDSIAQTMFALPLSQSVVVQNRAFSIVGVCLDPINNGKVTYISLTKLQSITNNTKPNAVLVRMDPLADRTATLTSIQEGIRSLNSQLTVYELDEVVEKNLSFLDSLWSKVKVLPLFTLTSAALCLIGFLMLTMDEQRQEFGVLRATGAKPRTVTTILAVQSMVVLLLSCAIGISFGIMITLLMLVPEPLVTNYTILEIVGWLLAALVGMFIPCLCSAAKLARKPILEILR